MDRTSGAVKPSRTKEGPAAEVIHLERGIRLFERESMRRSVLARATREFRAFFPQMEPAAVAAYVDGFWRQHQANVPARRAYTALLDAIHEALEVAGVEGPPPPYSLASVLKKTAPRISELEAALVEATIADPAPSDWGEGGLNEAIVFRDIDDIPTLRDAVFWAFSVGPVNRGAKPSMRALAVAFILATNAGETTWKPGDTAPTVIGNEARAMRQAAAERRLLTG